MGKIEVTVNKTTAFHPDPTKEIVDLALQEKAAAIGADAVIITASNKTNEIISQSAQMSRKRGRIV